MLCEAKSICWSADFVMQSHAIGFVLIVQVDSHFVWILIILSIDLVIIFIILFVKLSFHFFYFFTFKLVVDLVISIYASNQILSFIILANRRSLILTNWGKDSIGCVLLTNKKKKKQKTNEGYFKKFSILRASMV